MTAFCYCNRNAQDNQLIKRLTKWVIHVHKLSTQEAEAGDYCEFEDSLDYLVSSRLALVTRIKPLNQKQRRSFSWLLSSEVT